MSVNVRKGRAYTDQKYDWTQKGTDVSAMSFHKVMSSLYKADAMNEWGSIVALTYMAAQRVFPDYNDMADNKAYLESIARSFGYFFGRDKKVRVNTISQSPTPTTAGQGVKGFDGFISYAEKMSPLGNATALDCANYTVTLFSDLMMAALVIWVLVMQLWMLLSEKNRNLLFNDYKPLFIAMAFLLASIIINVFNRLFGVF